jgi:DNA sulfur modification protein DndD
MKFKKIHAENYKTYKLLDLDLEVTDDRPIVLIGGGNGCGKTTLFDAIYHALYGLKIENERHFEELFNAGVKNEQGLTNKYIVLEVTFSGMVLNQEQQYKLKRAYMLDEGRVLESVTLNMGGNQFTYGSGTPSAQRASNEEIVNKIIAANLPAELSNYFLFDAMKTSDLVKEEQINKLIMKNINSVMGFNKYAQLRKVSDTLLSEKKAERMQNDKIKEEYTNVGYLLILYNKIVQK